MNDNEFIRCMREKPGLPPTDENLRRLVELMGRMYPNNPKVRTTMQDLADQYRAQGLLLPDDPGEPDE